MEKEIPEAIALRVYYRYHITRGFTRADSIKKALAAVARAYPGIECRDMRARGAAAIEKEYGQGESNG